MTPITLAPNATDWPELFNLSSEHAFKLAKHAENMFIKYADKVFKEFLQDGDVEKAQNLSLANIAQEILDTAHSDDEQNYLLWILGQLHARTRELCADVALRNFIKNFL